jgi:hypothetical protein
MGVRAEGGGGGVIIFLLKGWYLIDLTLDLVKPVRLPVYTIGCSLDLSICCVQ